jgi:hypothetical protein
MAIVAASAVNRLPPAAATPVIITTTSIPARRSRKRRTRITPFVARAISFWITRRRWGRID